MHERPQLMRKRPMRKLSWVFPMRVWHGLYEPKRRQRPFLRRSVQLTTNHCFTNQLCRFGGTTPKSTTSPKYTHFSDIDECEVFNTLCVYGKCENTLGIFRCECYDGYKVDGTGGNCTDIDECESPMSCLYGECSNTQGSFKCLCPPNYELVAEGNACIGESQIQYWFGIDSGGVQIVGRQDVFCTWKGQDNANIQLQITLPRPLVAVL